MANTTQKSITIYRNRCIGCGYCLSESHNFLQISPHDGKIIPNNYLEKPNQVIKVILPIELTDSIIESCQACPSNVFKF